MTSRTVLPEAFTMLDTPEQMRQLTQHAGYFLFEMNGKYVLAWTDEDGHMHGVRPWDEDDHNADPVEPDVLAVNADGLYDPDDDPDSYNPVTVLWHDAMTAAPERPAVPIEAFADWLATGQRGISSEAIASHLSGIPITTRRDAPWDPSDFRRCERLLRTVPAARAEFHRMAEVSAHWARLVDVWDELVALAELEAPGAIHDANGRGSLPRLFARMTALSKAGA